ncbi:Uncharacterized conserved protein [Chryseobacterium nakagawai]|uniref:DUF262 domain-containing protein n=1 Tax=Chryseobacterium nakagawai TaxID=1241982 RepID=A0AAD1DRG0_CHRNA|nr:DUF262 domain-containing protein [Chryseobacterium nakagawai]AZA91773.1 DUF262 domain-containing protein [Chryseobacterium nakagawai]VEH18283.1 Uncharacterized conserved protein [Chryseobacterium nakagawai]
MENILELKTINDLKSFNFFIPSYQRGYRWTTKEVLDLLTDIDDFKPKQVDDTDEKTWYCLQPVVVKKNSDDMFEVIDGQQRLTTIFLILHYLNQYYAEGFKFQIFGLTYETRIDSGLFLQSGLIPGEIRADNVDFFHISTAYKTIHDWIQSKQNFNRNNFESKLFFDTKVIWYESLEDDPIAIFTRINIGKIPLTNAELIKALFLNSSNFDKKFSDKIRHKQLEISTEWDQIEQALQRDKFWYFLNGNKSSTNRIEFIFNLMNDEKDVNDNYSTFRFFNKKFKNKNEETIHVNWAEIKTHFQRFDEWYNKRDWYHKVGFLVNTSPVTIKELYNISLSSTKTEFQEYLDKSIKDIFKNTNLEELQYGDKKVKDVLLLYNILTMLRNENDNSYFPFDVYKNKKWDIEHITSVTDTLPDDKEKWLSDAKLYLDLSTKDGKDLNKRVLKYEISDDEDFEDLFTAIVAHFNSHLKDQDINDISNLALLDSETNRGYKNAVFPFKRNTIIEKDKQGNFIPICTKNVFLKYFSNYPPKISFWTQEDRDKYYADLQDVLDNYLKN